MFRKWSWLLGAAVALMLMAPQTRADGTPTPAGLHVEGTPETDHEHDHGERIPAGDASIRIISPADGTVLTENSVIVKVATTHWPLGEGKHWHLYVNGQEQGMSQGSSPSLQARDLMAGANTLEAVMSNELHQELDAVARVVVVVEIARMGAPGSVTPIVIGLAAAAVVIGGAAVLLVRKK